jgi:hypothetical protein
MNLKLADEGIRLLLLLSKQGYSLAKKRFYNMFAVM